MQLPVESVTTVDFPSDDVLVEKLPLPAPEVTVPPGVVVLPLTLPPLAVTELDRLPPPGGDSPGFNSTTLQLLVGRASPVDDELELLELICAMAPVVSTNADAANQIMSFLMTNLLHLRQAAVRP